mgnify:FL=1
METFRRIMDKKWARWGVCLTVVFLTFFVIPVHRYRPTCGDLRLPGPMRKEFIEYFEYDMRSFNFYYIKFGDEIFMRFYNPLYHFRNSGDYMTYDDLISNSEKKYILSFFDSYNYEKMWNNHPIAKAARDEGLAWLRDHADDDPATHRNAVVLPDRRASVCTIDYALLIQTETIPPERRLRFFDPKTPESPTMR